MNIEFDVFKKYKLDYSKLEEYGFIKEDNIYSYKTKILNDAFLVEIIISDKIDGTIYDLEVDDYYTNFRVQSSNGSFVNQVRDEYIRVLTDIRNKCALKEEFIYPQSNRVSKYIKDTYNDDAEFLFDDDETGVFRNTSSNKWYGIIMHINKNKVSSTNKDVEVINIKLDPDKINNLVLKEGFYRAYHMNKKYWITIVLDDEVNDDDIFRLIDESYKLVSKK